MRRRPLRGRVHRRPRMPAPGSDQRRAAERTAALRAAVHRVRRMQADPSATRICGSAPVRCRRVCSEVSALATCPGRCSISAPPMRNQVCSGHMTCAAAARPVSVRAVISRRWCTDTATTQRADCTRAAIWHGSWRLRRARGSTTSGSTSRRDRQHRRGQPLAAMSITAQDRAQSARVADFAQADSRAGSGSWTVWGRGMGGRSGRCSRRGTRR